MEVQLEKLMQEAGAKAVELAQLRDELRRKMRAAYLANDPDAERLDAAFEKAKRDYIYWEEKSVELEREYYRVRRKNMRDK
ncbi:MAG: hypothetical protein P9E88_05365 [Candidatus Competibacter sp.]|nr:hypothetical protein [Candidatus Competibacter sp.]